MPDIMLRDVSPKIADRFRTGATVRGLKQADYLAVLFDLLDVVRMRAAGGDAVLTKDLAELRLEPVTE